MKVICTDRGQHKRRLISRDEEESRRFVCPFCRRDVQLTPEAWDRLVTGLEAVGRTEFDMSYFTGIRTGII